MIEHGHLRIFDALERHGTLTEAARALCLSQSALSHQIRELEKRAGLALWEKQGRNLRLTRAGRLMLETAQQVLPVLQQAELTLKAYAEGRQGNLRIGVECYPCYEWLTGVVGEFLLQMPEVDIDIINKFRFSGLDGLLSQHIDLLVTPDPVRNDQLWYEAIAEYELVLVVSVDHALAGRKTVTPQMLVNETLLSFPVPLERLDVMTRFFRPAGMEPAKLRELESLELMLQLVALGRGVCVLPEWLARNAADRLPLVMVSLGRRRMRKKLYMAMRVSDRELNYMQRFVQIGQNLARQSFR